MSCPTASTPSRSSSAKLSPRRRPTRWSRRSMRRPSTSRDGLGRRPSRSSRSGNNRCRITGAADTLPWLAFRLLELDADFEVARAGRSQELHRASWASDLGEPARETPRLARRRAPIRSTVPTRSIRPVERRDRAHARPFCAGHEIGIGEVEPVPCRTPRLRVAADRCRRHGSQERQAPSGGWWRPGSAGPRRPRRCLAGSGQRRTRVVVFARYRLQGSRASSSGLPSMAHEARVRRAAVRTCDRTCRCSRSGARTIRPAAEGRICASVPASPRLRMARSLAAARAAGRRRVPRASASDSVTRLDRLHAKCRGRLGERLSHGAPRCAGIEQLATLPVRVP